MVKADRVRGSNTSRAMNPGELERLRGTLEELSLTRKQLPLRQQTDKPILKYDTTLSRPVQLFNQGDTLPRREPLTSHSTTSTASTSSTGSASNGTSSHPHHTSPHQSASHHSKVHHSSSHHSGAAAHQPSSQHYSSNRHGPSHQASPRVQSQLRMANSVSNLSRPTRGVSDPYNRPVSAKEVLEKQNRQRQRRMQAYSKMSGGRSSAVAQDSGAEALQLNSFLRPHSGSNFPGKPSPPLHRKEMTASGNGDSNAELGSASQGKKVGEAMTSKGASSSSLSTRVNLQQAFALVNTTSAAVNAALLDPSRTKDFGTSQAASDTPSHSKDTPGSSTVTGPSSRTKDASGSSMAVTGLPPRPKDLASNSSGVTGLPPRPKDSPSSQGKEKDSSRRPTPVRKATVIRNPDYSPNQPYLDAKNKDTERKHFSADSSSRRGPAGQPRSVNTPPGESTPLLGRLMPRANPLTTTYADNIYSRLNHEASSYKAGMEESGAPFHHPHSHSANASTTYTSSTTTSTTTTAANSKVGILRKMPVTNTLTGTLYYKKSFREATRLVEQRQKKGGSTGVTAAAVLEHRPVGDGAPSSKLLGASSEEKGSRSSTATTTTTTILDADDEELEDEISTPSGERLPGDGEASIDDLDDEDDGIDDIYDDTEGDSNDEDSDDYTISSNMSQPSSASTVRLHPSVRLHSRVGQSPSSGQSGRGSRAAGAGEEGTQSFVRPVPASTSGDKVIQPALRQSLFPAIPPTLNFVPEGEKVEQLPWEIRKLLKWRMSPITPNIVKSALGRINFRITKKSHDWLGCFGKHMKANAFKALREYQKLNHFPGSFQLGRKDRLWRNLSKLQVSFGKKEFGFFPQTYVLPQDLKQLKRAWEDSGPRQKWIIKPPASARGIGIKVINKWSQVPRRRPVIVQRYLARPLLINDRKFDMRVYVYVSSYDPLRAYVFEDGLARFASCKYSSSMKNLTNKFVHLTNYSINKRNSEYQSNSDDSLCQGHKWSLKSLWNYLKKQGVNTQAVWDNIKDIVVKTLLSAEAAINSMVKSNVRSRYIVHELFGFDILLDDMLRPWILEVNISPSLHSNSQLDINVKGQMIKDMMNLAGFRVPDKNDVHTSNASSSAVDLSAHVPSNDYCMDKRLFSSQLAPDERAKHAHFCHRHQDEQVLQTMLDTLTPDDVRMLTESIDEDSRKGGFIRVFPTPSTRRYMRFMEQPRYYNLLLDQWVTRYNRMEQRGIALLQELCEEGLHLQNPTDKPRHQWCPPGSSMLMSARDKTTSPLKKESPPHLVKSSPSISRLPKMKAGLSVVSNSTSLLSPSLSAATESSR